MSNTGNVAISNAGGIVYSGITSGTLFANSGSVIRHSLIGGGGGGVVGGTDVMYDMDGIPLEAGQTIIAAFPGSKLRIGRIIELRRDECQVKVEWQRGDSVPKRPSIIPVHQYRFLVVT